MILSDKLSHGEFGDFAKIIVHMPDDSLLVRNRNDSGFIEEEHIDEEGFYELRVKLPRTDLDRILKQKGTEVINHIIAVQEQTNLVVEDKAEIA